jgi:UDP:flavonoid glycosyltransferase YjiC (YdhE family)
VTFATYPIYQGICEKSGFRFMPIGGPENYVSTLHYTREMLGEQSFETFVDRVNFDQLELQYAQLLEAARGADILVALSHVAPAHLVAEKLGIPYVACATCLIHIRSTASLGTEEYRRVATSAARWHAVLRQFRQDHQLGRRVLPFTSLVSEATVVLGALPSFLLTARDMRNAKIEVMGYPDHRQTEWMVQDDELRTFCDDRTVAFSFGSYADACDPAYFLEESVAACRALNLKCVFLSQHLKPAMVEAGSPDVLIRNDLAPRAVFPLVGAVVHHGGTGTLVAACKYAKPMVIVPFFLDQPMQAARMHDLIGCPTIPARDYNRDSALNALRQALEQGETLSASVRELMIDEGDGAERSAHRILSILKNREQVPRSLSS